MTSNPDVLNIVLTRVGKNGTLEKNFQRAKKALHN